MTFANEGDSDRAVRMFAGMLLSYAGLGGFVDSPWSVVAIVAGFVALTTGVSGWCPAYTAFGFRSNRAAARRCPRCEREQVR